MKGKATLNEAYFLIIKYEGPAGISVQLLSRVRLFATP